jgi:hypothetical protein
VTVHVGNALEMGMEEATGMISIKFFVLLLHITCPLVQYSDLEK